jgi:uncharacterized protein
MRRRTGLTLAVAALAVAVGLGVGKVAAEEPSDAAVKAYANHDYQAAVRLLRPLAAKGDDQAEFVLAMMYYNGEGVPQSYAEALELYRLAAKQGHPGAQHDLGMMYENGQGVPQNYVRAHMWYNIRREIASRALTANLRTSMWHRPCQLYEVAACSGAAYSDSLPHR